MRVTLAYLIDLLILHITTYNVNLLDQSLGFCFLCESCEGPVRVNIVEGGLPKRLVVDPHALQVQVGRDELVGRVALQR